LTVDEAARLARLRALAVLDTPPEALFDSLVSAAAVACGTSIALLSLLDHRRQWFKARHGLEGISEAPREHSFCQHALALAASMQDSTGDDSAQAVRGGARSAVHANNAGKDTDVAGVYVLEVHDAQDDPRFAGHPLVSGKSRIRFYAGAVLQLPGGHSVGTLCVLDDQPRVLTEQQRQLLQQLTLAAVEGLLLREQTRAVAAAAASQRVDNANARPAVFPADFLDAFPAAVAVHDLQLNNLYANREHDQWYGPSVVAGQRQNLGEMLGPERLATAMPGIRAAFRGETHVAGGGRPLSPHVACALSRPRREHHRRRLADHRRDRLG
jgi:GAF domain-containing protein